MPSKSAKQKRFMAAAANNPDFAKRAGIPQSVAREYHEADKGMYEGGLAPMNDIMQRGMAGGLERLAPGFATGGSSYVGNWGSRKNKDLRVYDLMAPWAADSKKKVKRGKGKRELKRREKARRMQEEGKWGDEILTDVRDPRKRRQLVRAGWVAQTPPETRKGVKGAKGKKGRKYASDLNKHTVFYPPGGTGTGAPSAGPSAINYLRNLRPGLTGGQTYTPTRANIMSQYISPGGAEGGEVKAFYGGPLRRLLQQQQDLQARRDDPDWEEWMVFGTEPLKYTDLPGKGFKKLFSLGRMKQLGWQPSFLPAAGKDGKYTDKELRDLVWFPPSGGPGGAGDGATPTNITPGIRDDSGYTPPASGRGPRGRGRGRRGGRGGGRRRPPPNGEEEPPRIVPPGRPPDGDGLVPPATGVPPDYVPPDPREGRDTEYSRALREHRARIAATLSGGVPGYAGGGEVRGYAEGGTSRADNPYPVGSARWKVWERKHGRDPNAPEPEAAPPPVAEVEEEDVSWWDRLRGYGSEEDVDRIEEKLEEMEQARGGSVGYQVGGTVRPPMGGVPPRLTGPGLRPPMGGVPPRALPSHMRRPQTGPGTGGLLTERPPGGLQQVTGGPGRPDPRRAMPPVSMRMPQKSTPLRLPPRYMVPPSMPRGDMPAGPMGGPRVPPNMRGMLQRRMMENRPRRGIPGPAGAGGAPNRVGQSDQQGGLSRALQRGTGRPPMSRRRGFYR